MEETLVSFILLLKEFASKVVSVRSGRGWKTSPVTTVACKQASRAAYSQKKQTNPDRPTVRAHNPTPELVADHQANDVTEL